MKRHWWIPPPCLAPSPRFSPIFRINSRLPPRSRRLAPTAARRLASTIGAMVRATHSHRYTPYSAVDVEARLRQGHTLVPASPPAASIVAAVAVVEHHSTHQRLVRQGRRFIAAGGSSNAHPRRRTAMNRRRNHVAKEEAVVPLLVPKLK